jgi:MerR family transcriptional regulator/heat shock protein HspR
MSDRMDGTRERRDSARGRTGRSDERERAVYIISVAAELAGVHPQTLRMYERRGLLQPKRTSGNTRRYSQRDIERIRAIQELTQLGGISLVGVKLFIEMREQLEEMERQMAELERELQSRERREAAGEIVPLRNELRFTWQEGAP